MQHFLRCRLDCHGLLAATGGLAGAGHVDRARRVCLSCNSGGVVSEQYMISERAALGSLQQQRAELVTSCIDAMCSCLHRGLI